MLLDKYTARRIIENMKEEAKQQIARDRQMKRIKTAMWILIALAIVISVFIYVKSIPPPAGLYDAFAKCIAQSGTKFYGAFWCPHCAAQKAEFGTSEQYLPYTECSLPDESGQTQVCIDKGIQSYPTWYFPDGSSSTGVMDLQTLSQKTGCPLPDASAPLPSLASSSLGSSSAAGAPLIPAANPSPSASY